MSFFKRLFGGKPEPAPQNPFNQLVRIDIPLAEGAFGLAAERDRWFGLEDDLEEALEGSPLGELDGNEIGEGSYSIYLYAKNAVELADFVRTRLPAMPPGTTMFLRHGDVEDKNAREETIAL